MSRAFIIADTHFGDPYIIKFENRPFGSVEAMDEALIDNWNSVVNKEDTVWVLGDFSMHDNLEKNHMILQQLNGIKILVKGNHDTLSPDAYRDMGFFLVYEHPVIVSSFYILSHEPLYVTERAPYCNIFGHVHTNPTYADHSTRSYCVSAERISYTPIALDDIIDMIAIENKTGFVPGEVAIGHRLTPVESDLLAVPDHYYEYNDHLNIKPLNERAKKAMGDI